MLYIKYKHIAVIGIFIIALLMISTYAAIPNNIKSTAYRLKPEKPTEIKNIPILMYHHVSNEVTGEKYYFVSPDMFLKQIRYLYESGYTPLTFDDLSNCNDCDKPVMITFDDGYLDNYTYAFPVLEMFDFKATIFISTGFIDKPGSLSTELLKKMSGIISFQSHTVSHPNLSLINAEQIEKECKDSRKILQKLLSRKISTIAYPYGQYNQTVIDITKKFYKYGVTAIEGYYRSGDDPYRIKRFPVTCNDTLEEFIRKLNKQAK